MNNNYNVLLQWVANLTLYLLTSLPMAQGYTAFPGSLLLRDLSVLGTLRELLLIIKVNYTLYQAL